MKKIGLRFSSSWNVCHVYSSDVNKDLEPKAKAGDWSPKANAKDLGLKVKAKDSRLQRH